MTFVHQNTDLVHGKSTGELISFGFSDRSVRSFDSANSNEKRLYFWLLFGLSPNLGLSKSLGEKK